MGKLIKLTNSLLVPPQFCHQGWPFLRTPLAKCHWYGVISKHISIMEIPWIAQNQPNDVSINKDPIKMKKDQILYCIAMKRRPWVNYLAILRDAPHLQNGWIFWKIPKGWGFIFNPKIYIADFGPLNRAFSAWKLYKRVFLGYVFNQLPCWTVVLHASHGK